MEYGTQEYFENEIIEKKKSQDIFAYYIKNVAELAEVNLVARLLIDAQRDYESAVKRYSDFLDKQEKEKQETAKKIGGYEFDEYEEERNFD